MDDSSDPDEESSSGSDFASNSSDESIFNVKNKEEEVKNGGDISALFRYVNGNLIIYDSAAKIYTG